MAMNLERKPILVVPFLVNRKIVALRGLRLRHQSQPETLLLTTNDLGVGCG